MQRTIVIHECDNCGAESTPEEMAKTNPIPANWVALDISNNHGMLAELLLCEKCDTSIQKALAKRKAKTGKEPNV